MAEFWTLDHMRFVVSRGDTNNPEFLRIVIPPSTLGFKHARIFPKGFRFEVTDPEHIRRVKEGQFAIEDDGSPRNSAEIAKIDAEVTADMERKKQEAIVMKRSKKEPWTRSHKLQVIGMIVAVILAIIGWSVAAWLAFGRGAHQSHSTPAVLQKTNSVSQTGP